MGKGKSVNKTTSAYSILCGNTSHAARRLDEVALGTRRWGRLRTIEVQVSEPIYQLQGVHQHMTRLLFALLIRAGRSCKCCARGLDPSSVICTVYLIVLTVGVRLGFLAHWCKRHLGCMDGRRVKSTGVARS